MNSRTTAWLVCAVASVAMSGVRAQTSAYPADLLVQVRAASNAVPGARPTELNFIKIAESHRTYAVVVEGGDDTPFVSARTAFQAVYPDGSVMIDAGMDEAVHRFYGFGREEPYWPARNETVQTALRQANLIVVTHEHGDHVAGVLRSPHRDEIAPKTLLTRAQVETLTRAPQLPEIRLTEEQAADYIIVDYETLLPVGPGIVLIRSPGHTPGHQMVYIRLAGGAEYLLIGDIGWSIDNVTELKLRPEATMRRIGEDPQALMSQLTWLQGVVEQGVHVVPSHDDSLLTALAEQGLLGDSLTLR
ncbi:MAG: MBL fold metallo-hydrolase [Rhodospirillaceae bacterium]|nr:MBL fold metallo-hydrolase [Rhodospirillaceae bacterium]